MARKVVIDENSGFCFGVINAIRTAEEHLREHPFLYCLGDIVHNSEEVRRLTSMGLRIITNEQLRDLRDTTVLIRAHGEPPETYRLAEENRIRLIDATCPVVLRLQKRIHDEYRTGGDKQILIFGKKGHAEVVGLLGQTDNTGIVISSSEDIERKRRRVWNATTTSSASSARAMRLPDTPTGSPSKTLSAGKSPHAPGRLPTLPPATTSSCSSPAKKAPTECTYIIYVRSTTRAASCFRARSNLTRCR